MTRCIRCGLESPSGRAYCARCDQQSGAAVGGPAVPARGFVPTPLRVDPDGDLSPLAVVDPDEPAERRLHHDALRAVSVVAALLALVLGVGYLTIGHPTILHSGLSLRPVPTATPLGAPTSSKRSASSSRPVPPSRSSANSATGAAELTAAQAIETLAQRSADARAAVQPAINAVSTCGDIPTAIATLTNAATNRKDIIDQLASVNAGVIPGGHDIVTSLTTALQESAAADTDYAGWGRDVAGSCVQPAPPTANSAAAHQHDLQATAAKQAFIALWNPFATGLGLSPLDAGKI